jgi:hypothetical protein
VKTSMGSSLNHKRTNHHSGEEQERGPWFTAKGLDITVTMKEVCFSMKN